MSQKSGRNNFLLAQLAALFYTFILKTVAPPVIVIAVAEYHQ